MKNEKTSSCVERILKKAKKEPNYEFPNMLFYGEVLMPILEIIKEFCYDLSMKDGKKLLNNFKLSENKNILYMDCVYESSIIDIRNRVQYFIKSQFHLKQGRKIVIFNNLDELNDEAQCALRLLMEQNSSNIFLGIAKELNNVVSPICSRMLLVYVNGEKVKEKKKMIDYKYNKKTHMLFVPLEKGLNHCITSLNSIVDELEKESDVDILVECLNNISENMYKQYSIEGMDNHKINKEAMNLMNKRTLIMVWLIDYLEIIMNFVKIKKNKE